MASKEQPAMSASSSKAEKEADLVMEVSSLAHRPFPLACGPIKGTDKSLLGSHRQTAVVSSLSAVLRSSIIHGLITSAILLRSHIGGHR
jgi:hypothetical protein